jgi:hypothetical protein
VISLIFLNYKPESAYTLNQKLVSNYKKIGDAYLADIRRGMSKQLTDYGLYRYLQDVYNAYWVIIGGLAEGTYEDTEKIYKDQAFFEKQCDEMLKNIKGGVPDKVYDGISIKVSGVKLLIQKLIYIVSNYCERNDGGNV